MRFVKFLHKPICFLFGCPVVATGYRALNLIQVRCEACDGLYVRWLDMEQRRLLPWSADFASHFLEYNPPPTSEPERMLY